MNDGRVCSMLKVDLSSTALAHTHAAAGSGSVFFIDTNQ
jgi:hypothetical protein